jgi:hypothetical protein
MHYPCLGSRLTVILAGLKHPFVISASQQLRIFPRGVNPNLNRFHPQMIKHQEALKTRVFFGEFFDSVDAEIDDFLTNRALSSTKVVA